MNTCMYGKPHTADVVAVRGSVGNTVGWLCAAHYKQHEHALLQSGYHFRTRQELAVRGELTDDEQQTAPAWADVAALPVAESQFSPPDDSRPYPAGPELEPATAVYRDPGRRSYGGATVGPAASERRLVTAPKDHQAQEIVETSPDGTAATGGGLQNRRPDAGGGLDPQWPTWAAGAGHVQLTAAQRAILQEPFQDHEISIRYDGVVYAGWRRYWSRMVRAFAPSVPAVVPVDSPREHRGEVIIGVVMLVDGKFIGKAWGSHRLQGQNDRMSFGDRIESAISDAIAKIGKRLDMGEALWDEQFRAYWMSLYAYEEGEGHRKTWKRRAVHIEEHE